MTQQPEGPLVVGSVEKFLARLAAPRRRRRGRRRHEVAAGTRPLAETLRGELPYHEQIRLGIVTPRTGRRTEPEDPPTPTAPTGNE